MQVAIFISGRRFCDTLLETQCDALQFASEKLKKSFGNKFLAELWWSLEVTLMVFRNMSMSMKTPMFHPIENTGNGNKLHIAFQRQTVRSSALLYGGLKYVVDCQPSMGIYHKQIQTHLAE
jgi:hypothetical protein